MYSDCSFYLIFPLCSISLRTKRRSELVQRLNYRKPAANKTTESPQADIADIDITNTTYNKTNIGKFYIPNNQTKIMIFWAITVLLIKTYLFPFYFKSVFQLSILFSRMCLSKNVPFICSAFLFPKKRMFSYHSWH